MLLHCTNRAQKIMMEMKGAIIKTPQCLLQAPDPFSEVLLLKSSQCDSVDDQTNL